MNRDLFFRKVYTVAFRLTGEENIAAEMATLAITNTVKDLRVDYEIRGNVFQSTILELVKIFLNNPCGRSNDPNNVEDIQRALLKLKPLNRTIIVWKDVLGYTLSDNIPVADYSYEELLMELVCGRKEIKIEMTKCFDLKARG